MVHQALQDAQARLDQLQRHCDEAFLAYEANHTNDLRKERYGELKSSLHNAEEVVKSLATAAGAASASGWQLRYALYFPARIHFCITSVPILLSWTAFGLILSLPSGPCESKRSYHLPPCISI